MTPGWHRAPYAVLDTETTGVDPLTARLVTCHLEVPPGLWGQPWVRSWTVDPGIPIPAEASAVHGLYDADVAGCIRHEDAVWEIHDALAEVWQAGLPVVVYNAPYDLTVLSAPVLGPVIDPLVLDKVVDRYRKGSRRLQSVCDHYGVSLGQAHDVREDALAAGRVAWALAERFPYLARMDPAHLHQRQVRWYAEQAAGLREHFRRTGGNWQGVDSGWPLNSAVSYGTLLA